MRSAKEPATACRGASGLLQEAVAGGRLLAVAWLEALAQGASVWLASCAMRALIHGVRVVLVHVLCALHGGQEREEN